MRQVGRKIYYEKETGNVILDTGERMGSAIPTTVEQDFNTFVEIKNRVPETIDVIELPYGMYADDFRISNGYRVNVETKEIEFSYPDPNELEREPVYQKPLSLQVDELKRENTLLKAQNIALVDKTDFHEELIVELAMEVYK
ncbi:hypothetical protein AWH56_010705 [Anaerobacillus isosaccharinicus]|uniref:Uncharacterized protein n=1 Tax=Anaerobacillus isosaccharinicus TaxID=1532552 RepID=A0A1S2L7U8_9BACI|nr:hypothetical protein [Anaerobacillus isosaccharinicus]MBA5588601.1 hypothetical protein [Anaerobacillus isosaccharinicus]QOY37986.1 hypothetical protein AWH56_010705 [Anaerobacillus isosaccharinicus]